MKKKLSKILALALSIIMIFGVLPVANVFAEEENVVSGVYGKIVWSVNKEDETLLISYEGKAPDFASNETLPYAAYSDYIKNVIIAEGATGTHQVLFKDIGDNVENVTLPSTLTSIASYTFFSCKELKNIHIPDSVTNIGDCVFYNCRSLTSVTIPDSVTSIGVRMFCLCSSLTSVKISNNVTKIGGYMFGSCSRLTNVIIPDSVTSISGYAFNGCSSLTSVTIPDSVTSIGEYAFSDCNSLTSVKISDSVTSIGEYAFRSCKSLTSVTIPDSATSIGNYVFAYCYSLTSVVIGSGIKKINSGVFDITEISQLVVKNDDLDISNLNLLSTVNIYANEGSKAQEYALSTGREFRYLEDFIPEETPDVPSTETCEHIYNDKTTEPTCLAGGYIKHICEKCGDTYIDNVILPLGHSYGDPIIDTPATCTENGTQRLVCTACGNEVEETITAPGHVIIVDKAVPATCEEEGLTEGKHCINCGKVFVEQQTIEALSHHYVNHEGREATCTEGGWKAYQTCTRCDYTNYATLTALGHTDSNSDGICDRCSEKTETSAPTESDCTCRCHSKSLLYLIAKFLYKYIGINIFRNLGFEKLCDCGAKHW